MYPDLRGKTALITGAARGIGRAIAGRLAAEGVDVGVLDVSLELAQLACDEIREAGGRALPIQADIRFVREIRLALRRFIDHYGKIDVLVNNAGVLQNKLMMRITEEDWDRVVDTNMKGMFFCIQSASESMIERKSGRIVNVSSVSGRGGRAYQVHYASSKAAVISITRSVAQALGDYGITTNAICPSIVPTSMWEQADKEKSELLNLLPGQAFQQFVAAIPLKRPATTEEVASVVAFLCSAESSYINGQAINICGGLERD